MRATIVQAVALVMGLSAAAHAEGPVPPTEAEDPAVQAIRVYQRYLSSMRHVRCRFAPSCSEYAAQAIEVYGLAEGSARAADRLMRCNASAPGDYPMDEKGLLLDPVIAVEADGVGARVPGWLLPPPTPDMPPRGREVSAERRAPLDDVLRFAHELEWRGDCDRAATEYQRVASLAGGSAVEAWAFARIGGCQFAASRWSDAEGSYLAAAMLAGDVETRVNATWMSAAGRFNVGSYQACKGLLSDRALFPDTIPSPPAGDSAAFSAPASAPWRGAFRAHALTGLCGLARGEWAGARGSFQRAAEIAPSTEARERLVRLAAFAPQGDSLPHRSPDLATAVSIVVPGSGQMYCGRWHDGVRTLLFNTALIWTVVSFAGGDHIPAAFLTGSIAVPFYVGNVLGGRSAARQFDRRERKQFLEHAIAASSR